LRNWDSPLLNPFPHLQRPRNSTSWKISSANTFRNQSRKILDVWGCLLPESEVLTKQGWKCLKDLNPIETILQWESSSNSLIWEEASKFEVEFSGSLLKGNSTTHQTAYTPDHRVPYYTAKNNFFVDKASSVFRKQEWKLPLGGKILNENETIIEGNIISKEFLRVLVMVQADACLSDNQIRISFKRKDKIERCLTLLKEANIQFQEQSAKEDFQRFIIYGNESNRIFNLLKEEKNFGLWLLQLPFELLEVFIEELPYWDGMRRGRSFWYFTTNQNNAEIVATISHLVNRSATINVNLDNNNGYGSGNNKPLYTVNIKPRNYTYCEPSQNTNVNYTGKVYCAVSKTGFFLTRYNNRIHITGNTNLQNPSDRICGLYGADTGRVLVQADLAGAEALIVAYLCKDGSFRQLFTYGIKPHVFVAMHLFADFWEKELRKEYKAFSIAPFLSAPVAKLKTIPLWKNLEKLIKDDKIKYYVGKKSCHSFNYGLSWRTYKFDVLRETEGKLVLSDSEAERIYNIYHNIFPEIKNDFHVFVEQILNGPSPRILYNLFGHPKEIYQYPITDELLRKAIAFIPQSTVGELANIAFYEIQQEIDNNDYNIDLLNTKHDSILTQSLDDETSISQAAKLLDKYLAKTFTNFQKETFTMKTEIKVGKNWGDWEEKKNPEGMREYELAK